MHYEQIERRPGQAPVRSRGGSIPTYNLTWGLRTVDGTYNNLLNPQLGAADNEFPGAAGHAVPHDHGPRRPWRRAGSRDLYAGCRQ